MLNNGLWEELLKENLVWGAFGCHPHFANYYSDRLLQALHHPKMVAFGEMDLDYSYKCTMPVLEQHKVLERQLQLTRALKKPSVIHCQKAEEDLLAIMKRLVPLNYKIHRHCFIGNYPVEEPLLHNFSNLSVALQPCSPIALLGCRRCTEADTAGKDHRRNQCALLPAPTGAQESMPVCPPRSGPAQHP